jgi:hypothetical protein
LERRATEQFVGDHEFKVVRGLSSSDFVFVALLDSSTLPREELALVLLPDDYSEHRADLDALRDHALWQGGGRLHGFRSEVKTLVKTFEHEVLQPTKTSPSR